MKTLRWINCNRQLLIWTASIGVLIIPLEAAGEEPVIRRAYVASFNREFKDIQKTRIEVPAATTYGEEAMRAWLVAVRKDNAENPSRTEKVELSDGSANALTHFLARGAKRLELDVRGKTKEEKETKALQAERNVRKVYEMLILEAERGNDLKSRALMDGILTGLCPIYPFC